MSFLAALIPGILGLGASLIGSNAQNHANQQAQQAANQAAQGQNQLNQAATNIEQGLYNDYLQNYQPGEQYVGQEFGGLLSQLQHGNLGSQQQFEDLINALASPGARDQQTGIPLQDILGGALSYFGNPGETLSGAGGVGGQALGTYLNPETNLANASPITQGLFARQALQGLDPATVGAAMNQYDTGAARTIANLRNQLGAGVPNLSGTLSDLAERQFEGRESLASTLAGENQQMRDTGAQALLGAAGGLDQQTMQRIAAALSAAGGIDAQTASMLNQAYNIANQGSQQQLGNMGQGYGTSMDLLNRYQNWIGQGRNVVPGVASSMANMGAQYGLAGQQAAQNLAYGNAQAAQNNPFSAVAGIFANNPSLLGGGQRSYTAPMAPINFSALPQQGFDTSYFTNPF